MLTKTYKDSIVGLLITGGVGLVSTAISQDLLLAATGLASGIAINAIAPYASSFFEHFKKEIKHPDELNHHLQLIMKESINDALTAIRKRYEPENDRDKADVLKFTLSIIDHTEPFFLPTPGVPKEYLSAIHTGSHDELAGLMNELFLKVGLAGLSRKYLDHFKVHVQKELEFAFAQNLKASRNAEGWIAFQKMMLEAIKVDTQLIIKQQQDLSNELADIKNLNRSRARKLSERELTVLNDFNQKLERFGEMQPLFNEQLDLLTSRLESQLAEINVSLAAHKNLLSSLAHYITTQQYRYQLAVLLVIFLIAVLSGGIYYYRSQPFEIAVIMDLPASKDQWSFGDTIVVNIRFGKETLSTPAKDFKPIYFRNIPGRFRNDTVRVSIANLDGEPFRQHCDTCFYFLDPDRPIKVKMDFFKLDRLSGYIHDHETGKPLGGALVSINVSTKVKTDVSGFFTISIPADQQHRFQDLRVMKNGYRDRVYYRVPIHTGVGNFNGTLMKAEL